MSLQPIVFYIGQDPNIVHAMVLAEDFEIRSFQTLSQFLAEETPIIAVA